MDGRVYGRTRSDAGHARRRGSGQHHPTATDARPTLPGRGSGGMADTLALGASQGDLVGVRVPLPAPSPAMTRRDASSVTGQGVTHLSPVASGRDPDPRRTAARPAAGRPPCPGAERRVIGPPQGGGRVGRWRLAALASEVVGKVRLEGLADTRLVVGTRSLEDPLYLVRQQPVIRVARRGEEARDRGADDPARAAKEQESGAAGERHGLDGVAPDLGRDVKADRVASDRPSRSSSRVPRAASTCLRARATSGASFRGCASSSRSIDATVTGPAVGGRLLSLICPSPSVAAGATGAQGIAWSPRPSRWTRGARGVHIGVRDRSRVARRRAATSRWRRRSQR